MDWLNNPVSVMTGHVIKNQKYFSIDQLASKVMYIYNFHQFSIESIVIEHQYIENIVFHRSKIKSLSSSF